MKKFVMFSTFVVSTYLISSYITHKPPIKIRKLEPAKASIKVEAIKQEPWMDKYHPRYIKAFMNVIKEEGGYVNDPSDPGGETKYGISKRSYPKVDIKHLTLEQAAVIYKQDFYDKLKCDELPTDMIAQEVLEEAVNMGQKVATSFLQIVCKSMGSSIEVDGKIGSRTLEALKDIPEDIVLACIRSLSIAHYLELAHDRPPMRKFLKGWIKRVQT